MRDGILSRLDKLEKRVSELGSFVPPGSDSALRGERLSETMARVFQLWNKARGELDAANQHVKILEADRNVQQPPTDAYEHHGLPLGHYWVWYEGAWITGNWDGEDWNLANGVTTSSRHLLRGPRISDPPAGGPPTPDLAEQPDSRTQIKKKFDEIMAEDARRAASFAGGPPTPDLAASPNSNPLNIRVEGSLDEPPSTSRPGSDSPLREGRLAINRLRQAENSTSNPEVPAGKIRVTFEVNDAEYQALISARLPAGGPPTPDLAASPNSNTEDDDPDEPLSEQRPWPQRIGVYDYDSLVACLKSHFQDIFPTWPETDAQNMIELMHAEVMVLRRNIQARRDNA